MQGRRPSAPSHQQKTARKLESSNDTEPHHGDHSKYLLSTRLELRAFRRASTQDLLALPDGELERMQAGMREVLGEDGVAEWSRSMWEQEQAWEKENVAAIRSEESKAAESATARPPDFIRMWEKRHKGREWGYVAMRTACYDDDDKWNKFIERWNKIIEIPFEREKGKPRVEDARAKFEIRWVEESGMDGASTEKLQERYKSLSATLPAGLRHPVFLNVTVEVIDSILNNEIPTPDSKWWRSDAPFVLAISESSDSGLEEDHEENEWFKETFKVAVEVLIEEFWIIIASDMMPLTRLTRNLAEDDIWWSVHPSPERMNKRRRLH